MALDLAASYDATTEDAPEQQDMAPARALPSSKKAGELFRILKDWYRLDNESCASWKSNAKSAYEFRAGDQWSAEDQQTLREQQRPCITFNRVLTFLKAVAGMELNGRHEIKFSPRGTEDTAAVEVINGASDWMADQCDAEDEQSAAFEDVLTSGLGVVECRLDFDDDPKGKYIEEVIDPFEMSWDRTAKKANLSDARRMWRTRRMPVTDAQDMFPGKERHQLNAVWATGFEPGSTGKTLEERRRREENQLGADYDDEQEVTLVHAQWIEREPYWLVDDPVTGGTSELSDEEYATWRERAMMLGRQSEGVRMRRKVYKQAFLGGELLSTGDAPLKGMFSWAAITGEYHRFEGSWFGLVRVMMDPQMWANKWMSQTLHILNTQAKGGIMAEKSAFDDVRQAEESWAQTDRITWMADGALSGGKWAAKPYQQLPAGHVQLMEVAVNALRDVTGINLELLGLRDVNQPGILEAMRKQAGMTVLATMFNSLRKFRKDVGRKRLYLIQNFFNDERMIRITGPNGAAAVPLTKQIGFGDYDVEIDDAPTSPNQKEANWQVIQPMLAVFKDELMRYPQILVAIMEYSPLPARLVEMLKLLIESQGKEPTEQQRLQIAAQIAAINKDESVAKLNLAKAGASSATATYDLAMSDHLMKRNNLGADNQTELADLMKKVAEIQSVKAKTAETGAKTFEHIAKARAAGAKARNGGGND